MKAKIAILLLTLTTGSQTMALEKPEYEVLYTQGKIEYRLYQPYLVAETEVERQSDRNDAADEGFRRLFNYITGANTAKSSIAMTAPVQQASTNEKIAMTAPVQQAAEAEGWRVSFMLPSEYSLANAPDPVDARIHIREVPARIVAAIRYSGRWTTRNVNKYEAVLREHLATHSIQPAGSTETAVYNAPFTPPFMRRNEVMLEVTSYPDAVATTQTDLR